MKRLCFIAMIVLSTVGCDQVTKIAAREVLQFRGALSFFNNTLRLEYAENPGAFLSLGAQLSSEGRFWIFSVMVAIFLAAVAYQLLRKKLNSPTTVAYSLILGGGVGNLIDRLAQGHVTDFLNMGIGNLRTGIFNVADAAIVAGVLILSAEAFLVKNPAKEKSK